MIRKKSHRAIRQQSMKHFTVGTRLSSRRDALSPAHGFRPNGLAWQRKAAISWPIMADRSMIRITRRLYMENLFPASSSHRSLRRLTGVVCISTPTPRPKSSQKRIARNYITMQPTHWCPTRSSKMSAKHCRRSRTSFWRFMRPTLPIWKRFVTT